MKFDVYIPGKEMNEAGVALGAMLQDYDPGVSYADMMRLRISGKLSDQCVDTYFVAHEAGVCYSRLWHGWGKHKDAVGNFGNFMTLESCRGQGIGKQMLTLWYDDLTHRQDVPLALFCSAAERPAQLYYPYGFRPAIEGRTYGPLYRPLGNSPETFRQFCEMYYQPADFLVSRPATVQYRHEVDCLLKFALIDQGLKLGIGEQQSVEEVLLYKPGQCNMLFTEQGRCVGWEMNGITQVHPQYTNVKIEK